MSTLKDRKEQFVTGLAGGTTLEIYTVTSVSLVAYLAFLFLYHRLKQDQENKMIIAILDFLLNWVFLLLSITIYASETKKLVLFLVIPIIIWLAYELIFTRSKGVSKKHKKLQLTLKSSNLISYKSFLTVYRSQMMIITMLAILAVDFHIFPRRFAKVETWGTSMMDLGVGSFVFSYGLFSSKAIILNKFNGQSFKFRRMMWKSIRDSIPLMVLGFIRLISVKMIGYQEHVTEYGYHWNFFFTLGFLPFFVTLCLPITKLIPQLVLSLLIALIYEVILVRYDLLQYVLLAPRIDLISLNKEGIFSFIGYLAIFLSGQSCGFFLLPGLQTPKNLLRPSDNFEIQRHLLKPQKSIFTVTPLKGLIYTTAFYHSIYYILSVCYTYTVSRRIANLPYVIWVCAYNTTFLALFYLISKLYEIPIDIKYTTDETDSDMSIVKELYLESTPLSLEALNRNGLILFLISNLLTGLVNITFNTLDAGEMRSLLILISYGTVLAAISAILYKFKIFIKL